MKNVKKLTLLHSNDMHGDFHTFIDEPAVVNGIPVVQTGTGTDQIGRFDFEGEPVDDERIFTVGLQHYHYLNSLYSFGITVEELNKNHPMRTIMAIPRENQARYIISGSGGTRQ